ncbi:NADH-quinone oxidoreductase subunit 5 family protein [Candidatus Hodarchaeum mangrovi]
MAVNLLLPELAFLIPLIPICASFIILFFGKFVDRAAHGNLIALLSLGSSFILTLFVSGQYILNLLLGNHLEPYEKLIPWFSVGEFSIDLGILLDPLSTIVSLMVSLISFLVIVYSRSYMSHEGSPRYYAEMNMFAAAMLGLCLSPNMIQLFLFWEVMGVCSYLLIGYFYTKESVPEGQPHPASAAKKAFLTTKVGDIFLFLGIILLFTETLHLPSEATTLLGIHGPTLNFLELRALIESDLLHIDPMIFVVIALLIFGGAVGKSAQFPLHVWLPDAMAGPTTVSCLIHSATMVKAGIFLVARSYFIFEHANILGDGTTLLVLAGIGGITAILAGTIALVQTDIKGILAYSTISQLGYMTIGLGVAGMPAAIFHVLNHGIFKALLFLSAGSVIHGAGTQDIREMGGLKEKMPHTWKVMLIGSLSLAGIGNGFFSKDAIILHALHRAQHSGFGSFHDQLILIVWLFSVITAFLTAFYIFRMWFLVFPGKNRKSEHHVHESDRWMTGPLWTLSALSVVLALYFLVGLFIPDLSFEHKLVHWLEPGVQALDFDWIVGLTSIVLAILGISLAYLIYYPRGETFISFAKNEPVFKIEVENPDLIAKVQQSVRKVTYVTKKSFFGLMVQKILEKGYFLDALYLKIVHLIYTYYCEAMNWIEKNIFDRAVRFIGLIGFTICGISKWWDDVIIDGIVRFTAHASIALCGLAKTTDEKVIDHGIVRNTAKYVMRAGVHLRKVQTGVIENYALYSLAGAIIILLIMIIMVGVLPL